MTPKLSFNNLFTVLCLCLAQLAFADSAAKLEPVLNVRGEAQLQVPPDQVMLNVGVASEAKTAKRALADNSKAMNKIIVAIKALGLTDKNYKTRRLDVQPVVVIAPTRCQ